MTDDDDDRRLLARIAERDRVAFEAFFRAHGLNVHRFVRDLGRDDGLAEELTSDVMVEIWRGAHKYGGRSRVRTWMFGIAHHKAIDALRRRRATTIPLDDLLGTPAREDGPEDTALRGAERGRLDDALATLSAEHRAVLELTYLEGFSQAEIAAIASCPVATVKTRAFYAKQRLRDALTPAGTPVKHEISDLLPFYVNGTLAPAERERVEAELATCAACSEELHEHEQLAAGLRARADATPPLPAGVLARALARIDAPPPLAHTIPLHTPWFAAPARYATAAVLVVGFGAVAAAAWHVREANVAQEGQSAAVYGVRPSTATPPMMAQAKVNVNAVRTGAPKPATIAAQTTVERQHRLAKHAQLEIVVTEVEPALRRAQATARAADGVVVSLVDARPSTPGTLPGADLTLEVPAQRLDETSTLSRSSARCATAR
jgi:RNA polymerase sigma-70 factor (ECF subfamily)